MREETRACAVCGTTTIHYDGACEQCLARRDATSPSSARVHADPLAGAATGIWKGLLAIGLMAVIAVTYSKACGRDESGQGSSTTPPAAEAAYQAPAEREPVFIPRGEAGYGLTTEQAKNVERDAMYFLWGACSKKNYAWREGSVLKAEHVSYDGRDFINISVEIAHPEKANGDVLWYVLWRKDGRFKSIEATKRSAAALCDLPESNVEYDIDYAR